MSFALRFLLDVGIPCSCEENAMPPRALPTATQQSANAMPNAWRAREPVRIDAETVSRGIAR